MSNKSRRRVKIAAGAILAGAAIPIAAAGTAWADEEITHDGKIVFDNFPDAPARGSSDVGTVAQSGTDHDWAVVRGPASDATLGVLADDSATGDAHDRAVFTNTAATATPVNFYGDEGATIVDGTGDRAIAKEGSVAAINPLNMQTAVTSEVTHSSAVAINGSAAFVTNDGLGLAAVPTVTNDHAHANGVGSDGSPTVSLVFDAADSGARARDTGFNETTLTGGSATDLATHSHTYSINDGSSAIVEGTPTTAVNNSSETTTNGNNYVVDTSNTHEINGNPVAAADLGPFHMPLP